MCARTRPLHMCVLFPPGPLKRREALIGLQRLHSTHRPREAIAAALGSARRSRRRL